MTEPIVEVGIRPAQKSEAPILQNLLELYLHDFSEFSDVQIGTDGRFGYPFLDHYWTEPDRFPFLIQADGRLAGFALVRNETDLADGKKMIHLAEFFILRQFRRQQVGSKAAVKLWDLIPGLWQVQVLMSNRVAYPFWQGLIASYSNQEFEETNTNGSLGEMKCFTFGR